MATRLARYAAARESVLQGAARTPSSSSATPTIHFLLTSNSSTPTSGSINAANQIAFLVEINTDVLRDFSRFIDAPVGELEERGIRVHEVFHIHGSNRRSKKAL